MSYAMTAPSGPAWEMVYPELRKSPEPITPPMAIMTRCRAPMDRRSPDSVDGGMVG
jgi:hypothetical protein